MQLAALHKPVDLPPTNHTVYVIQCSQACLGTVVTKLYGQIVAFKCLLYS